MKELHAIMTREFKANDVHLSKEQAIVLKRLCDKDGQPQNDLTIVTSRDKTSLTRLLAKMESKELIKRQQSDVDKRVNLVYITNKGLSEIEKATPVVLDIFNRAISGIDNERIEATKVLLNDIYKNMNLKHEE
jgi:DNA-binding MarR family transcriptional regulator